MQLFHILFSDLLCSLSRLVDELLNFLNMLSRPKLCVPCTMYNLVREHEKIDVWHWPSKRQSQDEYNYKQLEVPLRFAIKT